MPDNTPMSKIRIKIGRIEIEYEGSHDYLSEDLPKLLQTVTALRADVGGDDEGNGGEPTKSSNFKGTVAAIAAQLGAKSGPDLVIAALAKLTLVDNIEAPSREALLTAMKSATAYYKQTYSGNLSGALKSLQTKGRITEPATDRYALTATEVQQLTGKLSAK